MNLLKLVTVPDRFLRSKSHKIKKIDYQLLALANKMIYTMDYYQGVGLAAPQIHELRRMFVIRLPESDPLVFVNPEIISQEGSRILQEGCLSVPNKLGMVKRPEKLTLKTKTLDGRTVVLKDIDGLLCHVISHELDHLNGVVFIDKEIK